MSALARPRLFDMEFVGLEDDRELGIDPAETCRFCQCSEAAPCAIPLRQDEDGNFYLARSEQETTMILPCSWFIPRVCTKPECIEKLLLEARGKFTLFDAYGNRAG